MTDKAPIFTRRSLELITKVVAIYCVFHIVTVLFKSYTDSVADQVSMSEEYVIPMYIVAGLHLLLGLMLFLNMTRKKYSWLLTLISIVLVLASRIWFEELAIFVNSTVE